MNKNSKVSNSGAFVVDHKPPYQILEYNQNFLDMMKYTLKAIRQKVTCLSDLVTKEDFDDFIDSIEGQLSRSNLTRDQLHFLKGDGKQYPVLLNGQIFTLEDNSEVISFTCTDLSSAKSTALSLQPFSDLEAFSQSVRCGLSRHICDNSLTLIWANDYFYKLFGYTREEYEKEFDTSLIPMIYPEDLSLVVNSITSLLEEHEVDITFRIRHKSKPFCWVNLIAASIESEESEDFPVANFVLNDVTSLKYAEMRAELEAKKYEIISDISEEIPFEYEIATDTVTYAKKYEDIFGRKSIYRHPVKKFLEAGIISEDTADSYVGMFEAARQGERVHSAEYKLRTKQGNYEWHYSTFSSIPDKEGNPSRVVGVLRNIDSQKKEQAALLKKAQTDSMTGLLNKATTETFVKEHLKEMQSGAYDIVMLVDIDDFKNINDTYGHLTGDEVILDIAHTLMRFSFKDGFVGRIGGDEFLVYLPNVLDKTLACEKAEKYADALREKYPGGNDKPKVTLSIGIAATDVPIPYSDLIEQADAAVYQAKLNGKDCYVLYNKALGRAQYHNERRSNLCNFDPMVISNAIGILSENADTTACIQKAINYVGEALNIDRIAIWEYQADRNFVDKTIEYQSASYPYADGRTENLSSLQWEEVDTMTITGSYHTANAKAIKLSNFGKGAFSGAKEFMQNKFSYQGSAFAYIGFFNYSDEEVWSTEKIETFKLFSSALTGHMQKKYLEEVKTNQPS
jgi:diguanylate cyclase (GGDEF)-like protein/PAS domain S-box-containing protein